MSNAELKVKVLRDGPNAAYMELRWRRDRRDWLIYAQNIPRRYRNTDDIGVALDLPGDVEVPESVKFKNLAVEHSAGLELEASIHVAMPNLPGRIDLLLRKGQLF